MCIAYPSPIARNLASILNQSRQLSNARMLETTRARVLVNMAPMVL